MGQGFAGSDTGKTGKSGGTVLKSKSVFKNKNEVQQGRCGFSFLNEIEQL